jgi:signal transduction histidine kinase
VVTKTSFFARISKNTWSRYALALSLIAFALMIHRVVTLSLNDYTPFVALFPAVAFSAMYCGLGPSILSAVLALLGAKFWFIPVKHSLQVLSVAQLVGMVEFLVASAVVIAMGEVLRRHHVRLLKAQGELEDRVMERTAELNIANEGLRHLSARLLQMQDDERRRIARELHDSVGQALAALTMNLTTVRTDIERLKKTAGTLADSEALVEEMTHEVRTISHLLHPPLLDEAGLASALQWYVEGFAQRSKIQVDLELPEDFDRLPQEAETTIFRIVQESLTNIHRHSESKFAKVRITRKGSDVRVEVEDRGKGMTPEKQVELASVGIPGVGIRGMRERLRQLGGNLEIRSNGEGTTVVAHLPVTSVSATAAA